MGLIIAGERSGVGKTTVTLALLSYLKHRAVQVQSFKVGPDYIDPMFHRYVTGRSCRNLDPVLTSETYVQQCFDRHTQTVTHALIEGVMGLFDGAAGQADFASTAHIARLLDLPVLLVLNCSGMSHSIAALVHGYRSFDPRLKFAGVVLNRVGSDRHLELLESALEPLHIPVLGVLRRQDDITIPDRHLGLIPTAELENLNLLVEQLAHLGETCFDWTRLMPLLETQSSAVSGQRSAVKINSNPLPIHPSTHPPIHSPPLTPHPSPRIAIAHDSAFSFYYADNLDLLEALGAELVFWSPMRDQNLPENVQGLYFGGGFPEVFAEQLAANEGARCAVQTAIQAGMPTYAECGGLMYLCEKITDFEGQAFPMVGVLPTTAVMGKRLTLGYRRAIALHDSPVLEKGADIYGHEFHRSYLTIESNEPLFEIRHPSSRSAEHSRRSLIPHPSNEGWHLPNLHASYLHLHWGAQPEIPKRFLQRCSKELLKECIF